MTSKIWQCCQKKRRNQGITFWRHIVQLQKIYENKQQRDTNNKLRIENDTIIVLFAHIMESEKERESDGDRNLLKP